MMGRPPKYKVEFAKQAAKLCLLGATDEQLADFFEVERSTIWRWRVAHKGFANAIADSKSVADDRVERSLYSKALGYEYVETVETTDDAGVMKEVKTSTRHQAADNTAMIFWLKNRRGDKWSDRREATQTEENLESVLRDLADKLPG